MLTRETKAGLVVAGSFICLVVVVLIARLRGGGEPEQHVQAEPPPAAGAETPPAQPTAPAPEPDKPAAPGSALERVSDSTGLGLRQAGGPTEEPPTMPPPPAPVEMPAPPPTPPPTPEPTPAPTPPPAAPPSVEPPPVGTSTTPPPTEPPVIPPQVSPPTPPRTEPADERPVPIPPPPPVEPPPATPPTRPAEPTAPTPSPMPDPPPAETPRVSPAPAGPDTLLPPRQPEKPAPDKPVARPTPPQEEPRETMIERNPTPTPVRENPVPPAGAGGRLPEGFRPTVVPEVESWDEDIHTWKSSDTFQTVSRQFYEGSDIYWRALLEYNRNHPLGADGLRANPPVVRPGQQVFAPPTWVLEKQYAALLPKPTPTPVASTTAVPGERTYRVTGTGEMFLDVAKKTQARWEDIYLLNRQYDPKQPIPAGTVLRLPANAQAPVVNRR